MGKDFGERSRRPRISTMAELAARLDNVRPYQRDPYTYQADAPCHQSKRPGLGDSFHFGQGKVAGLYLGCWSCGSGSDMVERIEDRFGVGIQVEWPNQNLRFKDKGVAAGPAAPRPSQPLQRLSQIRYHATPGPDVVTLQDLKDAKIWIAGWSEKKPWQQTRRGNPWAFRQSLAPQDGDLVVARFGGDGTQRLQGGGSMPIRVMPWSDLADIEDRIARQPNPTGIYPCLALSGSADYPHPTDCLIIDLDYKPDADTGAGRLFRAAMAQAMREAGAPMFASTSGTGWHAVLRMSPDYLLTVKHLGAVVRYPAREAENIGGSAFAEIFPAGTRRLILLRLGNPMANTDPTQFIPRVSWGWLKHTLQTARRLAESAPAQEETLARHDAAGILPLPPMPVGPREETKPKGAGTGETLQEIGPAPALEAQGRGPAPAGGEKGRREGNPGTPERPIPACVVAKPPWRTRRGTPGRLGLCPGDRPRPCLALRQGPDPG